MSPATTHVIPHQGDLTDAGSVHKVPSQEVSIDSAGSAPTAPTVPLQTWIEEINRAFGFSVGWFVKAGDLLARSKKQLGHGQWSLLFGPGKLKFGMRKAEMLMAVARHPSLRNSNNFSSLPTAWSTLYALSKLPAEVVELGIACGHIHSEMKLSEARQLARTAQPNTESVPSDRVRVAFDPVRQRDRLTKWLRAEVARWPAEYRCQLAELLRATALDLLAEQNADLSCPPEGSEHRQPMIRPSK